MIWTKIKRVIRAGVSSFWRNGFVSLSSLVVMCITLFIIGSMIFLSVILKTSLDEIKNKVDINVSFVSTAREDQILSLKKSLEALPEVSKVTYVNKDQALATFREKHKDDQLTLQSLDELGINPLNASLNVKAKEPSQYGGIAKFLSNTQTVDSGGQVIEKINYYDNEVVINRLNKIINTANIAGFWIMIIFLVISVIITFNTIRLAIFISKDEISIMRLVGASGRYVKGPFVIIGILYGLISAILITVLFGVLSYWVGGLSSTLFIGLNMFDFYLHNIGQIILIIFG